MSLYFHAPEPKDLGRAASSVMGDAAGQANLPAVRVPAQQQIESRMRGLPVNFRRVGQKNREVFVRNCVRGFLDIVHSVKVGIVDPRQMNPLPAAFDDNAFVEQHSYPHRLQVGDHADRIVIAQNAVHRSFQSLAQPRHPGKGLIERSKSLPPIVAGEDAKLVFQARQEVQEAGHRLLAHIRMQIAQMQDPEAIEGLWKTVRDNFVPPQPKLGGVPPSLPVKSRQPKDSLDESVGKEQILDMEEVQALPKDLRLMIHFDPEALTGMQTAEALLQLLLDIVRIEEPYRGGQMDASLWVSKDGIGNILLLAS